MIEKIGSWIYDSGIQEDGRNGERRLGSYHIEGREKSEWMRSHWGMCKLEDATAQANFLGYADFRAQIGS